MCLFFTLQSMKKIPISSCRKNKYICDLAFKIELAQVGINNVLIYGVIILLNERSRSKAH